MPNRLKYLIKKIKGEPVPEPDNMGRGQRLKATLGQKSKHRVDELQRGLKMITERVKALAYWKSIDIHSDIYDKKKKQLFKLRKKFKAELKELTGLTKNMGLTEDKEGCIPDELLCEPLYLIYWRDGTNEIPPMVLDDPNIY